MSCETMVNERKLPLRLDTEAFALGYYVVLDYNYKIVRECETVEEAEAFIAEANGSDVEAVQNDYKKQARMLHEYRDNLRRKLKQSESQNPTPNYGGGWSWESLPDEIKQRFPPPPERSKFSAAEEYEEARGSWQGRVGRNIGIVLQQYKRSRFPKIGFENPTIDLVRTYETYEKNNVSNRVWKHQFGFSVVNLALGVVTGRPWEEDLVGIRKCLAYEVSHLKRKEYLWIFPIGCANLGDDIKTHEQEMLVVDSLIFSIIEFHDHLHEHNTGLSSIVRSKLIRGFELVCHWASNGDLLNPDKNDWVVVRENGKWLKYISNAQERTFGRSE